MTEWTEATVEESLREAAHARRRLDRHPDPELASTNVLVCLATARQWMRWLNPDDIELVSLRSAGAAWKPICWRLGMSRPTAHRHWKSALRVIADRLNRGMAATNLETRPHRNNETSSMRTVASGTTISRSRRQVR